MTGLIVLLYILASLLVGVMGRDTSAGFAGHFLLSLLVTPVIAALLQLMFRPSKEYREALQQMKVGKRR